MFSLISKLTPLAVGAAVSPVTLAATILILSGKDRPLRRAVAFAFGNLVVLSFVGVGVLCAFKGSVGGDQSRAHSGAVDVAFGVLLLVLSARQVARIVKRRARAAEGTVAAAGSGESRESGASGALGESGASGAGGVGGVGGVGGDDPNHSDPDLDEVTPPTDANLWKYFGGGVAAMLLNFSTIVIYIPAVRIAAEPSYTALDKAVGMTYLTFVTMIATIGPIALYAAAPDFASRKLEPVGNWTKSHSSQIAAVLLFVIGTYLLFKGMRGT